MEPGTVRGGFPVGVGGDRVAVDREGAASETPAELAAVEGIAEVVQVDQRLAARGCDRAAQLVVAEEREREAVLERELLREILGNLSLRNTSPSLVVIDQRGVGEQLAE